VPRRVQPEVCLICGGCPCECFKKAKPERRCAQKSTAAKPEKAAQSTTIAPDKPESAASRMNVRAAMKEASTRAPRVPVAAPIRPAPVVASRITQHVLTDEELIFNNAIRLLAKYDMLDDENLTRFASIVNTEPSVSERLATWKALRRASVSAKSGDSETSNRGAS
jgi:hypothetical protein